MKLFEIMDIKTKQDVKFSAISRDSPIFQSMLDKLEQAGYPASEVFIACREEIEGTDLNMTKSPRLMETMHANKWETALFNFIGEHTNPITLATDIGAPMFKRIWMQKVLNALAAAPGGEFFPIRSVVDPRAQQHPMFEYSEDNPSEYGDISTAAAFPDGRYVFNESFMQSLINFAHLKEIKPTSMCFKCNGGSIPNEYGYAEFVIAHELLHYTNSDFHVQYKINNPNHTVINYVTDFRSNYILVKSGFSQLPIGLFSSIFNFDNYRNISKLYQDVLVEYNNLIEDSEDPNGTADPLKSQASDNHEEGTKAAQTGQEKAKADKAEVEDFDEHATAQDEKLEKSKESSSVSKDDNDDKDGKGTPDKLSSNPTQGSEGSSELDITSVKPVYTWTAIIRNMLASIKQQSDTSWAKMHRRSITTVVSANTTGAGAIKPGMRKTDNPDINLVLAIDSSGSMGEAINRVMAESFNLIRKHFPTSDFYIILWSSTSQLYRCNLSKNTATMVSSITDTNGSSTVPIKQIFATNLGGGTAFNTVSAQLVSLLQKNYNVIILTDADIVYGGNLSAVVQLAVKFGRLLSVILDSKDSFNEVTKLLSGSRIKNITHL
jgi:predicted metal-dependent peptidase